MRRRGFFGRCASSLAMVLSGGRLAASGAPKARLTGLELFRVPVNHRGAWLLVRIQTDQGISGIGDASHGGDDRVAATVRALWQSMKGRSFVDQAVLRASAEPFVKRYGKDGAVALGGMEQALWDIAGQAFGVPVRALFGGGMRDRIRVYANINRATTDRTPAGFAAIAKRAIDDGFDAIKLAPFDGRPRGDADAEGHIRNGIACVAAVRAAIGPGKALLVDGHSLFGLERGLGLARELEPFDLFWLEEVCPGIPDLAAVNRAARMPTAGGEGRFGVKGFYPYISGRAVDVVMPDIKYCGGLLELRKIAAVAEGAGLTVSPHGPASPVGGIAAAHVCSTLTNFLILEHAYGEVPWRAELIEPAETLADGRLTLGDRPGFGIRLDEGTLRRRATAIPLGDD